MLNLVEEIKQLTQLRWKILFEKGANADQKQLESMQKRISELYKLLKNDSP